MLVLILAVTTGTIIAQLRDHELTAAGNQLKSLAVVLADQAERAFKAIELIEVSIVEKLQNDGVSTPDEFRRWMEGRTVHEQLRNRIAGLPQVDALIAVDAGGNIVNFSRMWPIPTASVADRDYFLALKDPSGPTSFVGRPVRNRTNNWNIYIARKFVAADGAMLGLIVGAINLTYLERLYAAAAPQPDGSVALFRNDGVLLARHPHLEPRIGDSFSGQPIFQGLADPDAQEKIVRQTSLVDGMDRLYSRRLLQHFPIMLTVSNTSSSILQAWRQEAASLGGAAGLLGALIIAAAHISLRMVRGQRRLHQAQASEAAAEAARLNAESLLRLSDERAAAERAMHLQNERFGVAMSNMSQALCMFDVDDRLVVANQRLYELLGICEAAVPSGTTFEALFRLASGGSELPTHDAGQLVSILHRLKTAGARGNEGCTFGDGRSFAVNCQPAAESGWLAVIQDVTERRNAEARIQHMAHHDALTGLPNRVLFHDRLTDAIARGRRGDQSAVFCLNLDQFKSVNDTLGHPTGDALLRAVTGRLQLQVRECDTVARLGGDEFAIIQSGFDEPTAAASLALRVIATLSEPYHLHGHQVVIGTSIGIAVVPADGNSADEVLKNADLALYRAKADGRGCHRFFEPGMDALMQARRLLEMDLRRALLTREFQVFYQPLINVRSGTVAALEALIRWQHPGRGMISPAEFIPLAEQVGLIVPIGAWVLLQACRDAVSWPADVKVAVNLSPVQLSTRTLVRDVAAALDETGLAPARLELEITETAILEDTDATLATLRQLRALGVSIAMDDFGTGYSSPSSRRRFPFDKIKIDRSFIEGLGGNGDSDAIVGSIAGLCGKLGMATTAEGVETQEQLALIRGIGCTEVQGFLFSRPVPAGEMLQTCAALNQAAGAPPPAPTQHCSQQADARLDAALTA